MSAKTRVLLRSLLWVVLLCASPSVAFAQGGAPESAQPNLLDDPVLRGDVLVFQGDAYRAISAYKLFLMTASDPAERDAVTLKIAWVYATSEEYSAAAAALRELAGRHPIASEMGLWVRLYYADVARLAEQSAIAMDGYGALVEVCAAQGGAECDAVSRHANLGRAREFAKAHDFVSAAASLDAAGHGDIATRLRSIELPHKSPGLAGALSIVPGLGHFYIEEYGAGLVAMLWNGAFIYGFVDSLVGQKYGQATLIGLVELIWYSGTIFGALAGAKRFNRDARRIVDEGVRQDIDAVEARMPWTQRFPFPGAALERPLELKLRWSF
ncbi:MAG: hypothetical protein AAGI01_05520 [Myxococcota bacterium]